MSAVVIGVVPLVIIVALTVAAAAFVGYRAGVTHSRGDDA